MSTRITAEKLQGSITEGSHNAEQTPQQTTYAGRLWGWAGNCVTAVTSLFHAKQEEVAATATQRQDTAAEAERPKTPPVVEEKSQEASPTAEAKAVERVNSNDSITSDVPTEPCNSQEEPAAKKGAQASDEPSLEAPTSPVRAHTPARESETDGSMPVESASEDEVESASSSPIPVASPAYRRTPTALSPADLPPSEASVAFINAKIAPFLAKKGIDSSNAQVKKIVDLAARHLDFLENGKLPRELACLIPNKDSRKAWAEEQAVNYLREMYV